MSMDFCNLVHQIEFGANSIFISPATCNGPVRFAEKTSRNTVPTDLLWEKNTVPAEKQAEKYEL